MRISYSFHAKRRMEQRGISRSDLEYLLSKRQIVGTPDKHPGRMKYTGTLQDGRRIVMVIAPPLEETGPYTVITTFEIEG